MIPIGSRFTRFQSRINYTVVLIALGLWQAAHHGGREKPPTSWKEVKVEDKGKWPHTPLPGFAPVI